ncbi:MAG: alpha-glucan family phosphorylase [Steroidobacteraceae bacterium]
MQVIEIWPVIPGPLKRLPELAANLSFSWHRPTRALFEDLDPQLWTQTNGNPRLILRCVDQQVLDKAAADPKFIRRYQSAVVAFDQYLAQPIPGEREPLIAYFCAEYGFHESFPIYSGGLGILAADHCKSASDERLNFVAVGLLYRQGYFTQSVDSDGIQHPEYKDADPRDLPVEPVRDAGGNWLRVYVPIAGRNVAAQIWKADVGRVTVYLLDTNCPENTSADRDITFRLYGGDESLRMRQEMILGLGGLRALRAVGASPAVWHINEGHAAFLIFDLMREQIARGLEFEVALEAIAAQCVFTTHTPVAAGHDQFHDHLFNEHFGAVAAQMGVSLDKLLELGRAPGITGMFNMTRLALNGARRINGVSRIHGAVSSRLCKDHWSEVPPEENPIGYVTNGVHVPTFLAPTWTKFFDERLPDWRDRLSDGEFWKTVERLPDQEFWGVAQEAKSRMLAGVQGRLVREYKRKGLSSLQLRHITRHIDPANPGVLTIGFARRFATYKRAALVMRDRERLARLVNDSQRPVLFLFAGKAHPADLPGQQVLREIKQLMLSPEFIGRIVFLEDYDIQLARWLVAGVDVWLNNPIAPLEASGTSGIKAAVNGRLNLSIMDGWWAEAFDGSNGWGIPGSDAQDDARRDQLDSDTMLDALEENVVPMYYDRQSPGGNLSYSTEWVRYCKHAMASVVPKFSMRRAVRDYASGMYYPAAAQSARLKRDDYTGAKQLAAWKQRVRAIWPKLALRRLADLPREAGVAETLRFRVAVALAGLTPADVRVEFKAKRTLPESGFEPSALCSFGHGIPPGQWRVSLQPTGEIDSDGSTVFELQAQPPGAGQYAAEIRIYPAHELLTHPLEMGLMKKL